MNTVPDYLHVDSSKVTTQPKHALTLSYPGQVDDHYRGFITTIWKA